VREPAVQRIDCRGRGGPLPPIHGVQHALIVPAIGELFALRFLYPRVQGRATRLEYFVDKAIKEAGFRLATSVNIAAPLLTYEPSVRLLTGNGPQAIDQQTAKLRSTLTGTRGSQRPSAKQLTK